MDRGVPTGLPKGCSATPHLFRATPVNRPDPRRSGQCIYRGGSILPTSPTKVLTRIKNAATVPPGPGGLAGR